MPKTRNVPQPTASDDAATTAALNSLVALGLVDVVESSGEPGYRISKALCAKHFTPNAALRERLRKPQLC